MVARENSNGASSVGLKKWTFNSRVRPTRGLSEHIVTMASTFFVAGPFSNLSSDFGVLVDFLARVRAVRLLNTWETKPGQALALNRQILVHKFGHLVTLLWARLILGRFYDAVSHIPFQSTSGTPGFTESDDAFNFINLNQGGYRGRNVPGA